MKKKSFLKIDKRVSHLNETEAFVYMILVYAKFRKIQISRSYIQTAFGNITYNRSTKLVSIDYVTKVLRRIEEVGLIKRENKYTNAYNGGDIQTVFDYTLNYEN